MTQHPLVQLILARFREFYRQPEAVFWVYGFPVLLTVGLGIAFRSSPAAERFHVDVREGEGAEEISRALVGREGIVTHVNSAEAAHVRLRTGKTALNVISVAGLSHVEFVFDPTRAESMAARRAVEDALQRAAGRSDPVKVTDRELREQGGRYIDFLIPGIVGMNLMGGGLWGIGFVTVDMRLRKLLKRLLATPMRRSHFLLALMISRLMFIIPEMVVIIAFAWLAFGVKVYGSVLTVAFLIVLGSLTFAGIGLLVASRAKTLEGVSGLMNLVMLPMWLLCGIFFSAERFPETVQPVVKALPLTPLIDSLRAVMLEGEGLVSQGWRVGLLAAYGVVAFVVALRWFRWE